VFLLNVWAWGSISDLTEWGSWTCTPHALTCVCSILLEHEEACLVREQAAMLLTNLSSHSVSTSGGGAMLSLCHTAVNSEQVRHFSC
jgi:hypothetical protein